MPNSRKCCLSTAIYVLILIYRYIFSQRYIRKRKCVLIAFCISLRYVLSIPGDKNITILHDYLTAKFPASNVASCPSVMQCVWYCQASSTLRNVLSRAICVRCTYRKCNSHVFNTSLNLMLAACKQQSINCVLESSYQWKNMHCTAARVVCFFYKKWRPSIIQLFITHSTKFALYSVMHASVWLWRTCKSFDVVLI